MTTRNSEPTSVEKPKKSSKDQLADAFIELQKLCFIDSSDNKNTKTFDSKLDGKQFRS